VVLAPWDRESFVVAAVAGTGRGVARLVSLLPSLAGQLLFVARRSRLPSRFALLRRAAPRRGPAPRRVSSLGRRPGLPRGSGRARRSCLAGGSWLAGRSCLAGWPCPPRRFMASWRPPPRQPGWRRRARGRINSPRGGGTGLTWLPGTGPGFAGLAGRAPGIAGLAGTGTGTGTGIGSRVRIGIVPRQHDLFRVVLGLWVGRRRAGVARALPPGGPVGFLVLPRRYVGWRAGSSRVLRPRFTT
jgi:hypothetical protein